MLTSTKYSAVSWYVNVKYFLFGLGWVFRSCLPYWRDKPWRQCLPYPLLSLPPSTEWSGGPFSSHTSEKSHPLPQCTLLPSPWYIQALPYCSFLLSVPRFLPSKRLHFLLTCPSSAITSCVRSALALMSMLVSHLRTSQPLPSALNYTQPNPLKRGHLPLSTLC